MQRSESITYPTRFSYSVMKEYRSHLTPKQRDALFKAFLFDELATSKSPTTHNAAALAKVNKRTACLTYRYARERIAAEQSKLVHLSGTIEIDHHTFNARRAKRYKKIGEADEFGHYKYVQLPTLCFLVFGLLERDPINKRHRVFVQIVKRSDKRTTHPIVRHVVDSGSTLMSDMARTFNDIGPEYIHKRVNHAKGKFARKEGTETVTTATIDQFWQFCGRRLERFNGVSKSTIALHIQECAFRYNHRHDLQKALKKILH